MRILKLTKNALLFAAILLVSPIIAPFVFIHTVFFDKSKSVRESPQKTNPKPPVHKAEIPPEEVYMLIDSGEYGYKHLMNIFCTDSEYIANLRQENLKIISAFEPGTPEWKAKDEELRQKFQKTIDHTYRELIVRLQSIEQFKSIYPNFAARRNQAEGQLMLLAVLVNDDRIAPDTFQDAAIDLEKNLEVCKAEEKWCAANIIDLEKDVFEFIGIPYVPRMNLPEDNGMDWETLQNKLKNANSN